MGSAAQHRTPCFTKTSAHWRQPATDHGGAEWGIRGAKVSHWRLLAEVSSRGEDAPNDCLPIQGRREKPWEAGMGLQPLCAIAGVYV